MSLELAFIVMKIAKLGVGIEETNAGIDIPASMISVRYQNKKNARLHLLSPVPDWFRHR